MRRLLLLLALPVLLAATHGDTGTMEVVTAEQLEGLQVHLEVGVLHEDGDLAEEATVTAVLTTAGGARVGPVQLARTTGARYGADLFLPEPGTWTAVVTSTGPAAEATTTIEVAAETSTTSQTSTTTTTVPDEDGGGSSSSWIGWSLAALAGAGSFIAFRRTRTRREG